MKYRMQIRKDGDYPERISLRFFFRFFLLMSIQLRPLKTVILKRFVEQPQIADAQEKRPMQCTHEN